MTKSRQERFKNTKMALVPAIFIPLFYELRRHQDMKCRVFLRYIEQIVTSQVLC